MSIIGNPLIIGGSSTAENGVVFITDELDEYGGIIRHLVTDSENISTNTDVNGGTVVSVKGIEVQLQIKRVTPTSSVQTIEADEGYAALAKVIVEAGSGDILEDPEVYIPETTIAATDWTSTGVGWEYKGDNIEPIEVGATYKVIFNGIEYEVVGINIQGIPALGDSGFSFSTYPFLIGTWFDYNTISWYLYIPNGPSPTEPQTIAVYKERAYGIDPTSPLVGLGQVGSMII